MPDSSSILEVRNSNGETYLDLRSLDGMLLISINLNKEYDLRSYNLTKPPGISSDGNKIAFVAESTSSGDVFILSLSDRSLVNISNEEPLFDNMSIRQVQWMP